MCPLILLMKKGIQQRNEAEDYLLVDIACGIIADNCHFEPVCWANKKYTGKYPREVGESMKIIMNMIAVGLSLNYGLHAMEKIETLDSYEVQDGQGNNALQRAILAEDILLTTRIIESYKVQLLSDKIKEESDLGNFLMVKKSNLLNSSNNKGETALILGVCKNKPDAVRMLISSGAQLHLRDKKGNNAFDHLQNQPADARIQLLLALLGFPINRASEIAGLLEIDNEGNTSLHQAALAGNVQTIPVFLRWYTLLNKECEIEKTKEAEFNLLEYLLYFLNNKGHTPLYCAYMRRNNETREILAHACSNAIRPGVGKEAANPPDLKPYEKSYATAKDWYKNKVRLQYLVELAEIPKEEAEIIYAVIDPDDKGDTTLHRAVRDASLQRVHVVLELYKETFKSRRNAGKDFHLLSYCYNFENAQGCTPLYFAIAKGDSEIIAALIQVGANARRVHQDGSTVLHAAVLEGKPVLFNFLVSFVPIDTVNDRGDSALLDAIKKKNVEAVRALLALRASPYIRNNAGRNGYDLSIMNAYISMDIIKVLEEAGGESAVSVLRRSLQFAGLYIANKPISMFFYALFGESRHFYSITHYDASDLNKDWEKGGN